MRAFAGTLAIFLAGFGAVMTVLLLAVGPALWPLLGQDEVPFSPYIVLVLLTVPLNNLGLSLVLPLYYVRGQAVRYAAFSLFSFAMVTGGTVLFVVGLGQGAAGALWGRWIAALIVLVPTLAILRRNARPVFDRAQLRAALAFSLPLVPHLISAWALNFSDRIILGNFVSAMWGWPVGYQFGLVVSVPITGMNNAWTPWCSASARKGGAPVPRFATYYVMLIAALGVGAALLAREAVAIMTAPSYHAAWTIVPLVVLGYVINGLVARFMDVLLLHKRTGVVPLTTIAAGVANIAFNLGAIPSSVSRRGMQGQFPALSCSAPRHVPRTHHTVRWGAWRVIGLALLVAVPSCWSYGRVWRTSRSSW